MTAICQNLSCVAPEAPETFEFLNLKVWNLKTKIKKKKKFVIMIVHMPFPLLGSYWPPRGKGCFSGFWVGPSCWVGPSLSWVRVGPSFSGLEVRLGLAFPSWGRGWPFGSVLARPDPKGRRGRLIMKIIIIVTIVFQNLSFLQPQNSHFEKLSQMKFFKNNYKKCNYKYNYIYF